MKRILVRLFNIVYIAGASIAVFGLVKNPLISIGVSTTITSETLANALVKEENTDPDADTNKHILRETNVETGGSDTDIMNYLTKDKIQNNVSDINVSFKFEIEAKRCLDLKNKDPLNGLIKELIDNTINDLPIDELVTDFKGILKDITKDFAKDVIKDNVKDQIKDNFNLETADGVYDEHVDELVGGIVDDVYSLIDSDGTCEISDITNAIMGDEDSGLKGIVSYLNGTEGVGGQSINVDELSDEDIEKAMTDALTSVPGLTETVPVLDADGNPVLDADGNPVTKIVVNNIDDALATLLSSFMGNDTDESGDEKTEENIQNEEQEETQQEKKMILDVFYEDATETTDEEDLKNQIIEMIRGLIPEDIENMDLSFNGLAVYVLAGIIGLAALPWALFILVTLVRTLRKRKCWTKPWIVFFFAFLELIFGVGLTLLFSKGTPILLEKFGSNIPEEYSGLVNNIGISFKMSCYWASLVYLAMIPFTIIYMIICHRAKKDFKQYKKDKKAAKKNKNVEQAA